MPEVDETTAKVEATTEAEVPAEEETAGVEESGEEETAEEPKVKACSMTSDLHLCFR